MLEKEIIIRETGYMNLLYSLIEQGFKRFDIGTLFS